MTTLFVAALAATNPHDGVGSKLSVEGTEFVLTQADGTQLRSAQLIGTELDLPSGNTIRIDAIERGTAPGGGTVWLHQLSTLDADHQWQSACDADPDGRKLAFPLPGRYGDDGNFELDSHTFSLSCTSGARAKCVRFGYPPWGRDAQGHALLDHYNACVRMVRADYCGDGRAHTVNGTMIDLYDRVGVQTPDRGPQFRFEAGWSPRGAVCVSHTRIAQQGDLADLLRECPRLRDAHNGDACGDESAASAGAVLFNLSR